MATIAECMAKLDPGASCSGRRVQVGQNWIDSQPLVTPTTASQKSAITDSITNASSPSTTVDVGTIVTAAALASGTTLQQTWAFMAGGN